MPARHFQVETPVYAALSAAFTASPELVIPCSAALPFPCSLSQSRATPPLPNCMAPVAGPAGCPHVTIQHPPMHTCMHAPPFSAPHQAGREAGGTADRLSSLRHTMARPQRGSGGRGAEKLSTRRPLPPLTLQFWRAAVPASTVKHTAAPAGSI